MREEISFGAWLYKQRRALDLTRKALADQVGCAEVTLRRIENGTLKPSKDLAFILLEKLCIPENDRLQWVQFARGLTGYPEQPVGTFPTKPLTNLPSLLTTFIGREKEITDVRQYLLKADIRLVTLIGPPGIGKTSLSQRVAADSLGDFSDGVFFIALAPLNDPTLVASTIGQTLRLEGRGNFSAMELLKDGIADKQMLLVLDNFEHILEAVPIIPELLSACPDLKILVTSREALRVSGEWQYSVPPLIVPQISQSREMDLRITHDFSAMTLFAERAQAVHAGFNLTPENANVVAAICARLDGLPLAIELIAARMRLLSPQELLSRMDDRFTLHADGMRAIPARQKTLHNAIAWSYDLLTPQEQILFACLGVFAAGFTLEAAVQITENSDVLTGITALLDKSLLKRVFEEHGETRFTMLFTIREFALNRLNEMNETAKIRDQHLEYFLDLANQADHQIHGPRQIEWLDRFEAEHDNYRASLDWSISTGQTESALHLISKLGWMWLMRNYLNEARGWFDKVRSLPDVTHYPHAYTATLNAISVIAQYQDDHSTALSLAEESQHICQSLGSDGELGLAGALSAFGVMEYRMHGDTAHAQACLERAVAIYQERGDRHGQAQALLWLGNMEYPRREYEQWRSFLEDSLAIFRGLDDAFGLGWVYRDMAYLLFNLGDFDQARKLYEQSLAIYRHLRYQYGVSSDLRELSTLCRIQGDYDQAQTFLAESLSIHRRYGHMPDYFYSYFYLGCVMLHGENFAEAQEYFAESTRISRRIHGKITMVCGLLGLAAVAAGLQQYERAALMVGAGQAISDTIVVIDTVLFKMPPEDRIEIDPLLQIARDQLGEAAFEALVARGRAMTVDQAVAFALK